MHGLRLVLPAVVGLAALTLVATSGRLLMAWWYDDLGNLALAKGDAAGAYAMFSRGLKLAPSSSVLIEDRGRSLLVSNPAQALKDFRRADCGAPCLAEAGDAEIRLGDADGAARDYLAAKAVGRLAEHVDKIARQGRFGEALRLARALAARLHDNLLERADLASAYATIGRLDAGAADALVKSGSPPAAVQAYRKDAIGSYRRASELAPLNEGYLLSYGFAQADWGDPQQARVAFRSVLRMHPHQADAEEGLARLRGATATPIPQ